ncbi:hypothetical protein DFJ73DRAFT_854631, partial [Zopfochytrium polystomum]
MKELGVDISATQHSKTLDVYLHRDDIDVIVTVCDAANDACPAFPRAKKATRLHWSFPDPSKATGTEEEQMTVYREVRDSIARRIREELLGDGSGA